MQHNEIYEQSLKEQAQRFMASFFPLHSESFVKITQCIEVLHMFIYEKFEEDLKLTWRKITIDIRHAGIS